MKKMISAMLALLLLALTAVPAAAEEDIDYNQIEYVSESAYIFAFIRDLSSEATRFTALYYYSRDDLTSYIPKTLLDVELTPEILNGEQILLNRTPFRVDADNAYFSVRDGALFTKDGKTLLSIPHDSVYGRHAPDEDYFWDGGMVTIPDGTRELAAYSVFADEGACVVIPDSVTKISPECQIFGSIAAAPGGAAEAYAHKNGNEFIPMGETHTHAYFRIANDANCTQSGSVTVQCPCGKVIYSQAIDPVPDAHWYGRCPDQQTGSYARCCIACGKPKPTAGDTGAADCTCACHTICKDVLPSVNKGFVTTVKNCIYRLRLLVWRLTGTHQYCACGARHY